MKKYMKNRLDNHGSTLLLVVVSIAFIGVLGGILFSLVGSNAQMKMIDKKTKGNFYTVEKALNEVVAGIEQVTMDKMKESFEFTLNNYTNMPANERKDIFNKKVSEDVREELIPGVSTLTETVQATKLKDKLKNYLVDTKYDAAKGTGAVIDSVGLSTDTMIGLKLRNKVNDDGTVDANNYKGLKIKNFKITYTDETGYQTSIQTDLVIDIPDFNFDTATSFAGIGDPFNSYCLISDNSVDFSNSIAVTGNVYAGDSAYTRNGSIDVKPGIHVTDTSTVNMFCNNLVTRSDIEVSNPAKLFVKSSTLDGANVWANNLLTSYESTALSNKPTENTILDIEGNCTVKDDMILGAPLSDVRITKGVGSNGEYYGFSNKTINTGTTEERSEEVKESSSILVNGVDSTLDLSGLEKLVVAGRGFIKTSGEGADDADHPPILTGETIASKANQLAYLLPTKYINGINNNPFIMKTGDNYPEINYNSLNRDLGGYVTNNGYKKAIYHMPGVTDTFICYYYLDFKSNVAASEYFVNQVGNMSNVSKMNSVFNVDELAVASDNSKIITNGNYMTYTGGSMGALGEKKSVDGADLTAKRYDYFSMISKLLKGKVTEEPTLPIPTMFENIINNTEFVGRTTTSESLHGTNFLHVLVAKENPSHDVLIIDNAVDGEIDVPIDFTKGLIVATGGVKLSHNFEGTIIAKGGITVSGGNEINANALMLAQIFMEGDTNVNKLFNDPIISSLDTTTVDSVKGTTSKVSLSKIVSYDNWSKN